MAYVSTKAFVAADEVRVDLLFWIDSPPYLQLYRNLVQISRIRTASKFTCSLTESLPCAADWQQWQHRWKQGTLWHAEMLPSPHQYPSILHRKARKPA